MPSEDPGLARLNALADTAAARELAQCCAAHEWVHRMVCSRPFANRQALLDTADRIWRDLGPEEWSEAFAGHPRLGERKAAAPTSNTAAHWSEQEQAGMRGAADDIAARLADAQREYEARFGHIFLICATGLSAPEMLAALRSRMYNDPETELRVAAEEQRKITRIRLEKLLDS